MDLFIDDHYPGDAAHGCDYLTRSMQGDIQVETPDGIKLRKERVIITDREEDFEGRICIGERTVRHLAHKFGMVDDWRVDMISRDNTALRAELVGLSSQMAALRDENRRLAELERAEIEDVYVAVDGSRHVSERAALERCGQVLDCIPSIIADAVATADPIPALEASS